MSPRTNIYHATGFWPLCAVPCTGLFKYKAAAVDIARGDAVHIAAGYATNGVTTFSHALVGIANAACSNLAGDAGDKDVEVIPYFMGYQFIVPVAENTVLVQASHVGNLYGLSAVYDITNAGVVTDVPGFFIDQIDISAEAIVANTYGYAIGHFHIDS